jgi:transposase
MVSIDEILKLYNKGLSPVAIAEHFGVTRQAIYYRLKSSGVPLRPSWPRHYAKFPDKKLIEDLYHGERLSVPQVAERLGESAERIRRAMDRYAIERRPRGGQPKYPHFPN